MHETLSSILHASPVVQPLFRELGLDADGIFTHQGIHPWRRLGDRENCTLDFQRPDGAPGRWHVKRYAAAKNGTTPAQIEVAGHESLVRAGIPTADLIGWGRVADGRSFVIFDDLFGYRPADKYLQSGMPFETLLRPTADLAAKLHLAGLHHRDLYLCHFMVKAEAGTDTPNLRLIDTARVRKLPRLFQRGRWIVKDLAQFWYSTLKTPVDDGQRDRWIERYTQQRHLPGHVGWRRLVVRKVKQIARHDQRLRRLRPERNVSIPR